MRWLWFLWFCSGVWARDDPSDCQATGPCTCERPDGSVLDLTPAASARFYSAPAPIQWFNDTKSFSTTTYYFHPCGDAAFPTETGISNKCVQVSICKRDIQVRLQPDNVKNTTNGNVNDEGYTLVAVNNDMHFLKGEDNTITIMYSTNAITTLVNLICIQHKVSNLVVTSPDAKSPALTFYSPYACLSQPTNRHSLGTTLLIILFVMVLVYLIAGCCVKHFLMGARGIEVIPNLNFWRELPSLIRDGIIFVQNGFKPPVRTAPSPSGSSNPNPNSYDSI